MDFDVKGRQFFDLLFTFEQNVSRLPVLLLCSLGFFQETGKLVCADCLFAIEEFLVDSIEFLIRKHVKNARASCLNVKLQIDYLSRTQPRRIDDGKRGPKSEEDCLETFKDFPCDELDLKEIIRTGLYALNSSASNFIDVECVECDFQTTLISSRNLTIYNESPFEEHLRKSPMCSRSRKANCMEGLDQRHKDNCRKALSYLMKETTKNESAAFNSEFESEIVRRKSFLDFPLSFPTVESFVKAGFFYTKSRDLVRCFWCNGAIEHWDPMEEPIDEHIRWFPRCYFVVKLKGPAYIEELQKQYRDMDSGFEDCNETSSYDTIIGRNAPKKKTSSEVVKFTQQDIEARMDLPVVQNLIQTLGFEANKVMRVLSDKLNATGKDFDDLMDLAKACLEDTNDLLQNELKSKYQLLITNLSPAITELEIRNMFRFDSKEITIKSMIILDDSDSVVLALIGLDNKDLRFCDTIVAKLNENSKETLHVRRLLTDAEIEERILSEEMTESPDDSKQSSSLKSEHSKLLDEKLCVICKTNEKEITFLPCAHLVTCLVCSQQVQQCTKCGQNIELNLKAFIS